MQSVAAGRSVHACPPTRHAVAVKRSSVAAVPGAKKTLFARGLGMPALSAVKAPRSQAARTPTQAIFTRKKTVKAAPAPVEIEDPIYTQLTSPVVIGGVYAAFLAYAFLVAPQGTSELDAELVQGLFTQGPFSPEVNPLFFAEFNSVGIVPAVYAALLSSADDEEQTVPMLPFTVLSFFTGLFALGPYLLLRKPRTTPGEPTKDTAPFLANYFDSKANSVFIFGWAAAVTAYLAANITNPDALAGYADIFKTDQLANAALIDVSILSVLIYGPLKEDMVRRGMDDKNALLYMFPMVGPAFYYLTRPPLDE